MNPRSTDSEADALTTRPSCRFVFRIIEENVVIIERFDNIVA